MPGNCWKNRLTTAHNPKAAGSNPAPATNFPRKLPDTIPQEVAHCLGRFLLRGGGDVGVGVQGESCRVVAQHSGNRLDVHTILESQRRKRVAEIMEPYLG